VRYVEFRSTLPGLPVTDGQAPQTRIPADEYLGAVREAFAAVNRLAFRLVASIPRHAVGTATAAVKARYAARFLDIVSRYRDLVVGVDLTGIESGWSARLFRGIFAEARAAGLPVTIHAGETEGPDEIWAAIEELGASRIGHGTSIPDDPGLVAEVIRRRVVLEVCPTASWLIGRLKALDRHPVINYVPPIPFVICTDNPSLNASSLSQELVLASQISGAEPEAFVQSQYRLAAQAAFAPSELAAAGERPAM
jgi:aminodeoxyfutalosine deaminase